jgi:hypothetical protein
MDPEEAAANKILCGKCARFYASDEFETNKKGKRNKTCRRHSRKRSLELDDWENFAQLLRNWKIRASNSTDKDREVQIGRYVIDAVLTLLPRRTEPRY